eukprot:6186010-Pleurochrysis_carterae.AAC.8
MVATPPPIPLRASRVPKRCSGIRFLAAETMAVWSLVWGRFAPDSLVLHLHSPFTGSFARVSQPLPRDANGRNPRRGTCDDP